MGSIRLRLTLWCGVAIALMLAVLGVSLYLTLQHSLQSQFNASLVARATLLVDTLDWDQHRGFHVSTDFTPIAGGENQGTPHYFQIWTPEGKSVLRAPALGRRQLKFIKPPPDADVFAAVNLAGDHGGRELVLRFREGDDDDSEHHHDARNGHGHVDTHGETTLPQQGDHLDYHDAPGKHAPRHYILAVARPTEELDEAISSIGWSLAISCTLTTLVSAVLIAWLLHHGFRPVNAIAEQIAAVGATHLDDRISPENIPRELLPIVDRLNKLLERVEVAVKREKSLTADMAHELRTPLAGLRTAMELSLSRARAPEEYQHTLRQSLAISMQMQDMVENLLMLARLESGLSAKNLESCRLDQMLARQLEQFSDGILDRNVMLENSVMMPTLVLAPPELLTLVIRNVLDNAVSYVNDKGTIRVTLSEAAHEMELRVANTGSAVSSAQSQQVFERFWRGDASRTGQGRHSGLGLSIVQNAMRQIGGTATVESSLGGWFTMILLFPKHGSDGAHEV